MPEPVLWGIVFGSGIAAGAVNTVAGGGSLLTLPIFMLLVGMPAPIANGTSRVAVLVQSMAAAATYRRSRVGGASFAWRAAPPMCLGSLGGAWLATQFSPGHLQAVMGVVFLLCVPLVLFSQRMSQSSDEPRQVSFVLVALAAFVVGLYSGFLQAAVGLPILLLLVWGLGMGAVEANHTKVLLIGASMIVSLAVFARAGQVDLRYGAIAAAGQALGAFVGARLVIKRGLTAIRWALAITIVASALKMLGAF